MGKHNSYNKKLLQAWIHPFHPFPLIIAEASRILTFIDIIEVSRWNGVLEIILA